jgi:hypothetical protein
MAHVKACPIWRVPVMFGGGRTIENFSLVDEDLCCLKNELDSNHSYHFSSTRAGE